MKRRGKWHAVARVSDHCRQLKTGWKKCIEIHCIGARATACRRVTKVTSELLIGVHARRRSIWAGLSLLSLHPPLGASKAKGRARRALLLLTNHESYTLRVEPRRPAGHSAQPLNPHISECLSPLSV